MAEKPYDSDVESVTPEEVAAELAAAAAGEGLAAPLDQPAVAESPPPAPEEPEQAEEEEQEVSADYEASPSDPEPQEVEGAASSAANPSPSEIYPKLKPGTKLRGGRRGLRQKRALAELNVLPKSAVPAYVSHYDERLGKTELRFVASLEAEQAKAKAGPKCQVQVVSSGFTINQNTLGPKRS